jgi:hypothetical protein
MFKKYDLDKLKKYYPSPKETDINKYDVLSFINNISVCKFIKKETLTEKEYNTLFEELTKEYIETVHKPYEKLLYEFCDKYKIAPMKIEIRATSAPLTSVLIEEAMGSLGNIFKKFKNR